MKYLHFLPLLFLAATSIPADSACNLSDAPRKKAHHKKTSYRRPTEIKIVGRDEVKEEVRDIDQRDSRVVSEVVIIEPEKPAPEDIVYVAVEKLASFPGGPNAVMQYLSKNLIYPASAAENDIQGRVIVRFIVNKDGTISDATVVKGVVKELDNEALRVIRGMPKWIPAQNNGEEVRSYFTMPITFKLPPESTEE